MDIQSTQGRGRILPRQPDMQAQTRRAGATLNQFNRYPMPGNGGIGNMPGNGGIGSMPGNGGIGSMPGNGFTLQSLLSQLISALLAQLWNGNQPPAPTPQPVYGAVLPPDPIVQPVYGVIIEPNPPMVQPVYGAVIDPGAPVAVYGAPII